MRRAITFAAATAAISVFGVFGAGPALAHECFVANRSDRGNAAVSEHSAAWDTITKEFVIGVILGYSGTQFDCALAAWTAAGGPDYTVVGGKQAQGQDGTIAENNPNFTLGKASDGKGIEHAEEAFAPIIGQVFQACGFPQPPA